MLLNYCPAWRCLTAAAILALLSACSGGADLSGLLSGSEGEEDTSGSLSESYNLVASVEANQVNLSWSADSGASSYEIYRYTDSNCGSLPDNYTDCADAKFWSVTGTTLADTGLNTNSIYYYRIRSLSADSTADLSAQLEALTLPGAPTGFSAVVEEGKPLLSWDEQNGTTFNLYRYADETCDPSSINQCRDSRTWSLSDTSQRDGAADGGDLYYYQLEAVNSSGAGELSAQLTFLVPPDTPDDPSKFFLGDGAYSFNWDDVSGAEYYELFRYTESGCDDIPDNYQNCPDGFSFTIDAEEDGSSYIDNLPEEGITYYYQLSAANSSGRSGLTDEFLAVIEVVLDQPVLDAPVASGQSVSLSWGVVDKATSYQVYASLEANCSDIPDNPEDCQGYTLFDSTSTSNEVTGTSATYNELQAGSTYYFQVRAVLGSIVSPLSDEVSATTVPATPPNLSASGGDQQVNLTWDAVTGALFYNLWAHADASCLDAVLTSEDIAGNCSQYSTFSGIDTLEYTHAELEHGTTYYYYLSAENAAGVSTISTPAVSVITQPEAPQLLAPESNTSAISLTWEGGAPGVDYYQLYRYTNQGCADDLVLGLDCENDSANWPQLDSGLTSLVDTQAEPGVIYYYRLAAVNNSGTALGAEVSAALQLEAPQQLAVEAGGNELTLSWAPVIGVEYYQLHRYSGDCPALLTDTSSCSNYYTTQLGADVSEFVDSGLIAGTTYSYQLVAGITAAQDSELSAIATGIPLLSAPASVSASGIAGGVELSFSSVSGAETYLLYRYLEPGCMLSEATVNTACPDNQLITLDVDELNVVEDALQYQDTGLLGGVGYSYRLVATNANVDNSPLSAEVSATALLTQPVILSAAGGFGSATIEWSTVLGAEAYTIYQYSADASNCYPQNPEVDPSLTCSEGYAEYSIAAIASNNEPDTNYTYTATDLDGALSYGFRIQAELSGFASSELSAETILAVLLPAPDDLAATASANSVDLSWSPVTNAASYELVRSASADCIGLDDHSTCADFAEYNLDGNNTAFTDTGLSAGTAYYYRLRAIAADNNAGGYAQEVSAIPTLSPPANLQATAGYGEVELNWDSVSGAEQYTIYTYEDSCNNVLSSGSGCGDIKVETNSSINAHISKFLIGQQTYYFRVVAQRFDQDDSDLSEEVSAVPEVGVPLPSASAIESEITISWAEVAGIDNYSLHRSTGADCFTSVDNPSDYATSAALCPNYEVWAGISELSVSETVELGLTYYYATESLNVDGSSSGVVSVTTSAVPLAVPTWSAVQGSHNQVTLSWEADSSGAESYSLYRSAEADCQQQLADWAQCQQGAIFSGITTNTYTDSGLQDGTVYYYTLQANNYSGYATNPTVQSAITAPAAPEALEVNFSELGVNINWPVDQLGVEFFTLYRYLDQGCSTILTNFLACGEVEADTKFWTGADATPPVVDAAADLQSGTIYYYVLAAENSSGATLSAEYSIVTGADAPEIDQIEGGYNSNEISWDPVLGATSYNLFRYTDESCSEADIAAESEACGVAKIENVSSPYTDPPEGSSVSANLDSSTYYYYRLTSINESATSVLSSARSGLTLPAAPLSLTASGGDKSVTLQYSSSDSNLLSFIFSRDTTSDCNLDDGTEICPNLQQLDGDTETTYVDAFNLEAGKTYYYNAYAVNASGRSRPSNAADTVTIPEVPSDFSAAASSISQINLSWSRTTATDKYLLTRYLDPACDTSDLEANLSDCGSETEAATIIEVDDGPASPSYADVVTPNTYYYYRIQASNVSGNSDYSSPALEALPSPSRPENFAAVGGDEQVSLSWNAVDNVTGYYLYRYTDSGCASYITDIENCADGLLQQLPSEGDDQQPLSFYNDAVDVDNSTEYYYRLQALNISGSSAVTDEIESLTYPANPDEVNISVTSERVSLAWSLQEHIDDYELYRYTNSQCAGIPDNYEDCDNIARYDLTYPTNTRIDSGLDHGSTYYYKLLSNNSSGSSITEQIVAVTAPESPSNLVATPIRSLEGGMKISWDSDEVGVGSFSVYRYQPVGCMNVLTLDTSTCDQDSLYTAHGISARSFSDTNDLNAGEQYAYLVAAVSGQSSAYTLSSEVSNYTYPAPPAITELEAEANLVVINFDDDQTGANSYFIYRHSGPSGCLSAEGVNSNCNNLQEYSSVAQSGAIDSGLDSGTLYYYRIASIGVAGTGYFSDEYTVTTLPAQPVSIELSVSSEGVEVSWDNDQLGAESFILHRYRNSGCLALASDGSSCTEYLYLDTEVEGITDGNYTDRNLASGYQYFYRLQASNESGAGALSDEFSIYTLPPAPNAPELQGGTNQVTVTYERTTLSANSYRLYRYTVPACSDIGTTQFLASCGEAASILDSLTGGTNTIIDANLNSGTTYYYVLTAINESGEGLPSTEVSVTTIPDITTIDQTVGYQSYIEVEFDDEIESATSYTLYRYSVSDCFTETSDGCADNEVGASITSVDSPIIDANLDPGTRHYYAVTSNNASGSSDFSNEVSEITIPSAPVITAVIGANGFMQIEFDDSVAGASNYKLYRYASSNCIRTIDDYADKQETCEAITIDGTQSPIFDIDLEDGQTLYYRLAAENESGSSSLSAQESSITYPPAVDLTTLEVSGGTDSITLSWDDEQVGVDDYTLYRYQDSGCPNPDAPDEDDVFATCSSAPEEISDDSPVIFAELESGTTYYFTIKSTNDSGYRLSDEFNVTTVPSQPGALVLDAANYQIEVALPADEFPGAEYFHLYRTTTVNCVNSSDIVTCSSFTQLAKLDQAEVYELDYADFPYLDTELEPGVTYYYYLQAINSLGSSSYSPQSGALTAPSAPLNIALTPGHEQNTVQWSVPDGASNIYIYRYTNSGCATLITDINSCSNSLAQAVDINTSTFIDTDLTAGTTYYYTLEASNDSGSEFSAEYSSLTYPATPVIEQLTGGDRNISIDFTDAISSALSYTIYRYSNAEACITDNSADNTLNTSTCVGLVTLPSAGQSDITASPYTDTGLNSGAEYSYQLIANNASGISLVSASASIITLPAIPDPITLVAGDGNISIDWDNDITGNTAGTTLYRYTDPICIDSLDNLFNCDNNAEVWVNINSTDYPDSPPIIDTELSSNTTYYYVLQVGNSSGSLYSEALTALTYPSQPAAPEVVGANRQITINWDSIAGAVAYTIYYYTADACPNFPDCGSSNYKSVDRSVDDATSYSVGNLNYGTTYYAHLEVFNASGSSISEAGSTTTLTNQPDFTVLTGGELSIDLSWTSPGDGVDEYALVRYETPGCMTEDGDLANCADTEIWDHGSIASTETSFTDNLELEPTQSYYYRIGATNESGTVWSDEASAVTAPEIITPTVASGSESITIGWIIPDNKEVDTVTIYSTTQNGCGNIPPDPSQSLCTNWLSWTDETPTDEPQVVHTPDDPDLKYYYYLEANNTGGSSFSGAVEGLVLAPAPEFTQLQGGDQQISISWSATGTATYYTLYAYSQSCLSPDTAPNECGDYYNVQELTGTTATIDGLGIGETYYFRISVTNSTGTSALSDENSTTTAPSTPTNLQAVGSSNSVILSWDAATGATGYYYYQYTDPDCSSFIPSNYQSCSSTVTRSNLISGTSTTATNLAAGSTYYYRLTASNAGGESIAASDQVSAVPLLGAPANLTASVNDSGGISLSWIRVNSASSYTVYRYSYADCLTNRASLGNCTDGDLAEFNVAGGSTEQYTDTSTAGGSTYYYRVAAQSDTLGDGELSNEASATSLLQAPTNLIAVGGYGQVELSWTGADGAASYKLYRYSYADCLADGIEPSTCQTSDPNYFKQYSNITTTSYIDDTDLPSLRTYYYRVAASSADSSTPDSPFSNQVSAYVDLSAPQNVAASSSVLQIDISWDEVVTDTSSGSGVGYLLYRYTNDCANPHTQPSQCQSLVSFTINSGTFSYSDADFTVGGDDYQYRVQATVDGSGGDISDQVSAQPQLPAPLNAAVTAGSTSISLSWDAVSGADNYLVYRYSNQGCYTQSELTSSNCDNFLEQQTTSTTYFDNALDPTITYYYVVAAQKDGAVDLSPYSQEVSATPYLATPSNFTAVASEKDVVSLSWDAVEYATDYVIYYSTTNCDFSGFSASNVACSDSSASYSTVDVDNTTAYDFTNLTTGTTYYFQVKAFLGDSASPQNYSTYSEVKSAAPFAEGGITAITGGNQEVNLTYTVFGSTAQASIYRYTDGTCTTADLATTVLNCVAAGDDTSDVAEITLSAPFDETNNQVNDSGLKSGKRYYYWLWSAATTDSSDAGIWAELSSSAMTWPSADVGTTLAVNTASSTGTKIVLNFPKPNNNDEDNYYHILRHNDPECYADYEDAGTPLNRSDYTDWDDLANCIDITEVSISGNTLIEPSGNDTEFYTETGLAEGTTYYYLLRTVNYSGTNGIDGVTRSAASTTSNQVSWTTVPSAPIAGDLTILTSPALSDTTISMSLTAKTNATSYVLARYRPDICEVDDGGVSTVEACSGTEGYAEITFTASDPLDSYTDAGLTPSTEYAYRYRAINDAGSLDYSPKVTQSTLPTTPGIADVVGSIDADDNDVNVISISWSDVDGVNSRNIIGSTDQACLNNAIASTGSAPHEAVVTCENSISIANTVSSSPLDIKSHEDNTGIAFGLTYYFSMSATGASGQSAYSAIESNITAPAYPDNIDLTFGYQSINVDWTQPTGSDENTIYRYTNPVCDPETSFTAADCGDNETSNINSFTDPAAAFTDTNLADNTVYYYTIRTSNIAGYRYTQTPPSATTSAGIPPDGLTASGGEQNVSLSWVEAPGATNYRFCFGSELDSDALSNALSTDSMDCSTNLSPNTISGNGNSSLTYGHASGLDEGTTYYYWVRAETTAQSTSGEDVTVLSPYNPNHASATTLPATPEISLAIDGTTITATFTEVTGADYYRIYRSTVEGCLGDANLSTAASSTYCGSGYLVSEISQSTIDTVGASALSIVHSGLANSTLYYYQITAENTATSIYGTNESRLSEAASALTVPPAPVLTATPESTTEIKVTWPNLTWNSAATGGDWYTFYISETPNCDLIDNSSDPCVQQKQTMLAPESTSATVEHTFTGLAIATQYYAYAYASTSYNGQALPSELSAEVSTYTMANPATISSHTISRNSSGNYPVTFTWTADSSVDTYQLYLSNCQDSSGSNCSYDASIDVNNNASNGSNITHTVTLDSSSYYYAYLNVINNGATNPTIEDYYGLVTGPTDVNGLTLDMDYNNSAYNKFELTLSNSDSSFSIPDNDTWQLQYYSSVNTSDINTYGTNFTSSTSFPVTIGINIGNLDSAYLLSLYTFKLVASTTINGETLEDFDLDIYSKQHYAKHPPIEIVSSGNGSYDNATTTITFEFEPDISSSYSMPDNYAMTKVDVYFSPRNSSCLDYVVYISEIATDNSCTQQDSLSFGINTYTTYSLTGSGTTFVSSGDELYNKLHDGAGTDSIEVIAAVASYISPDATRSLSADQQYFNGDNSETLELYEAQSSSSAPAPTAPTLTLVPVPTFSARSFTYQPETSLWALDLTWLPEPSATNYYLHAYTDSTCPYLTTEPELCPSNQLQSTTPEFSLAYPAEQSGNYFYYRIQALDASANSSALGEQVAAYIPQPLNDSGITACVESETITGAQDCAHGRDSNFSADLKAGLGSAGFDFTANSQCLYDHVTGLHWFLGTQASTWAESNLSTTLDPETNATTYPALSTATANLQAQAAALCGGSNWSLPSLHELLSIADYNQTGAKIDTQTLSEFNLSHSSYWSASSHILDFNTGEISLESNTSTPHNTMLVRGERRWGTDFGVDRFQMTQHQQTETNTSLYLVYDTHTQLYYSPCLAGQSYDPLTHTCLGLATELDYIDSLNSYPTTSAWRQPNIKELIAILDPANNLMPNPQFFPTYPENTQIFTLTPSDQGTDYLLGRHLDLSTQSTQPTIFQLLTTHPIYANP